MRRVPLAVAAALLSLATAVPSQIVLDAPLSGVDRDAATDLPLLAVDAAVVRALPGSRSLELRGFPMPSGQRVDLVLRELDLARLGLGFQVDGRPAPGLLEGLDLSVWSGHVTGQAGSEALLSFSRKGTFGWVRAGDELAHLLPRPEAGSGWNDPPVLLARDEELVDRGLSLGAFCAADQRQPLTAPELPAGSRPADLGGAGGAKGPALPAPGGDPAGDVLAGTLDCVFWECRIAIETDWQLNQVFGGDLGAETAYVTTLLAAASDRYLEQIDTLLTYPYVQFYTSSNDPWSTPESGGSMLDMLDEFVPAWAGAIPAGANIGHFLSGAGLGGGVAYLGVLCDTAQQFSFAVSGNIDGDVPFPVAVGPLNWDFIVFTHETGHNFNSPHTHDYVPQIDNCANGDCISNGTIMSYCHLCSGGTSNVTTYFHEPTVVDVMKAHASSCLPLQAPLVAQAAPVLVPAGSPLDLAVVAQGTPVGGVDVHWRRNALEAFAITPASDQGGGLWNASLPAPACGDQPEWFFSTTDATCGSYQTASASAEVGFETTLLFESFEAPGAWTVGAPGDDATSGIWERGDPIGTEAQPEDDHSPAGTACYFTGQGSPGGGLGENDVDGGSTTLLSPSFDLSGGGDVRMGYWRWYSNDTSATPNTDVFVVDISNDDGGSWTNVETVGPAGEGTSGGWIFHQFTVSDFVAPSAAVRLRFVASDLGDGSLVEAAIDDVKVFRVDCSPWDDLGGGTAGIAGVPLLEMDGPLTPGSLLELSFSQGAPSAFALLFISFSSTPAPFLGGTLHAFPLDELVALGTDGAGAFGGSALFPGAASGVQLWFQVGVADGSVPVYGASLSNGVVGTVP